MPLTSGTTLGPYEILSPIGAGGMGEVGRMQVDLLSLRAAKPPDRLPDRPVDTLAAVSLELAVAYREC